MEKKSPMVEAFSTAACVENYKRLCVFFEEKRKLLRKQDAMNSGVGDSVERIIGTAVNDVKSKTERFIRENFGKHIDILTARLDAANRLCQKRKIIVNCNLARKEIAALSFDGMEALDAEKEFLRLYAEQNSALRALTGEDLSQEFLTHIAGYFVLMEKYKNYLQKQKESFVRGFNVKAAVDQIHATRLSQIRDEKTKIAASFAEEISALDERYSEPMDYLNQSAQYTMESLHANQLQHDDFPERLAVGKCFLPLRPEDDGIFWKGESIKYGFTVPLMLQFGHGNDAQSNLIFEGHFEEQEVLRTVQSIAIRFLDRMPISRLNLSFIDPDSKHIYVDFERLKNINGQRVQIRYAQKASDAEVELSLLAEHIADCFRRIRGSECNDILEYNKKSKETPESVYVLVLTNFNELLSPSAYDNLKKILSRGKASGVYTVLLLEESLLGRNKTYNFDERAMLSELFPFGIRIQKTNGALRLKDTPFHVDFPKYSNDEIGELFKGYIAAGASAKNIVVGWETILGEIGDREDPSRVLHIPIGKGGSNIQYLTLDASQSDVHSLVIGTTGSGKSNYLHAVIMGAMWRYPPDLLDLYLLDFKGGVEFKLYADAQVPHVKTLSLTQDAEDGINVLRAIEAICKNRKELYKEWKVSTLDEYNRKNQQAKQKRIFLIIDEIQELFNQSEKNRSLSETAINILISIAKQGRALGVSLLWASQTVPKFPQFSEVVNQTGVRVCLKVQDSTAEASSLGIKDENLVKSLSSERGLAVMKAEKDVKFRVAHVGDDNEKKLQNCAKIKRKWANFESRTPYLVGDETDADYRKTPQNGYPWETLASVSDKNTKPYRVSFGESFINGERQFLEISNTQKNSSLLVFGVDGEGDKTTWDILGFVLLSIIRETLSNSGFWKGRHKILFADAHGPVDGYKQNLICGLVSGLPNLVCDCSEDVPFQQAVIDLYTEYARRKQKRNEAFQPIWFFINSIHRYEDALSDETRYPQFSSGSEFGPPGMKFNAIFLELLKNSASYGISFVISIDTPKSISHDLASAAKDFNHKVAVCGTTPDIIQNYCGYPRELVIKKNAAVLFHDGYAEKLRPYHFGTEAQDKKFLADFIDACNKYWEENSGE